MNLADAAPLSRRTRAYIRDSAIAEDYTARKLPVGFPREAIRKNVTTRAMFCFADRGALPSAAAFRAELIFHAHRYIDQLEAHAMEEEAAA